MYYIALSYLIFFELTYFSHIKKAIRRCPGSFPPVSLLITVLQHVFVLCVLNLHYDSLEVTSIIKSVGWGYWGMVGVGLFYFLLLSHSVLYPFRNNLVYCVKKIIPFALVFPEYKSLL